MATLRLCYHNVEALADIKDIFVNAIINDC